MSRQVRDEGTGNEPIAIIGEAPGQHEEVQGRPFVGPSGAKLMLWLREAGLSRRDCYWTNVYPYRPPNNRIEEVPHEQVAPWVADLHTRLAGLRGPVVAVPTGNVALRALTGKSGITKHRGSIYAYADQRGRTLKVIPTIHPAATFRQPAWERRCLADWRRIAEEARSGDLRLPEREHFIRPTLAECYDYLDDARRRAEVLALDIETPRETTWEQTVTKRGKARWRKRLGDARITCVGFSFEPHFSFTIPTLDSYWATPDELAQAWDVIRGLCALQCEKAAQNGLFDTWWLAEYGIDLPNWRWDTRWMSHALDPLDSHDLAYQASRWTRENFWKDEAKDPDEASKYTSDLDAFWCVDEGVEAFTRTGWKTYNMLRVGDEILAFDPDAHVMRWSPIRELFNAPYKGEAVRVRWRGRTLAISTPNHRWWLKRERGKYRLVQSSEWRPRHRNEQLPVLAPFENTQQHETLHDTFVLRVAWVVTEGTMRWRGRSVEIVVYQHTQSRHAKRLTELFGPRRRIINRTEGVWSIDQPEAQTIAAFLGAYKAPKWAFYQQLSVRQLKLFWAEVRKGDGDGGIGLIQSRRSTLLDDLQGALLLAGVATSLTVRPQPQTGYKSNAPCGRLRPLDGPTIRPVTERVTFNGRVWCPRVDSGFWIARQNGVPFVTGNTYNGKDVAVTRELADTHAKRLANAGAGAFYARHYADMLAPLLALSRHGLRVNDRERKRRLAAYTVECIALQDKLTAHAGEPLYGAKDLSVKKLAAYLYDRLGLPRQHNRATGAVTTREVAVRSLMLRFPKKLGRDDEPDMPGPLILAHRRKYKLTTFLKEGVTDADGRMRSSFGFVSTGRLSSSKNPRRTGANSQNTDRELLDLYLPDEGCIFLDVDLSQAEDRVVKMLTNSPKLIERARAMPWENDEHRRAAALIFHTTPDAVTKDQRYLGKRARHAGNYGMRGRKLSEELLKEGYVLTPEECDRFINQVIDQDTPEVRDWQRATRQLVLRHRMLANSWGRTWDFTYARLSDDLFREAYAVIPQSEVVDLLNQWGFKPLFAYLAEREIPARINNQKHDSLLISTPPEWAWDLACFLKAMLERPRNYAGNALTIPCEVKLGRTAAGDHEFKRFPSRKQFDEVAYALA